MPLSPELAIYVLAGFITAWGISLYLRTRATRRVARGLCADCAAPWIGDHPVCTVCGGDRARQQKAVMRRPAAWGVAGIIVAIVGVTFPIWVWLGLGAFVPGPNAPADVGLYGATGLILGVLALVGLARSWVGDPAMGRLRCRACWYPVESGLPATCPECGKVATRPAQLLRTRRNPRLILGALALLAVAQVGWLDGRIRHRGLVSLMPTPILIEGIGTLPRSWIAPDPAAQVRSPRWTNDRLTDRIARGDVSDAQRRRVRTRCLALLRTQGSFADALWMLEIITAASDVPTPETAPVPSVVYNPFVAERRPTSPELDAAYAQMLSRCIRQWEQGGEESALATCWLVPEFAREVDPGRRHRLGSDEVRRTIHAERAALRALAAGSDDTAAALALYLLIAADLPEPTDLAHLESLAGATDPIIAEVALAALSALAPTEPSGPAALARATASARANLSTGPITDFVTGRVISLSGFALLPQIGGLSRAAVALRVRANPRLAAAIPVLMEASPEPRSFADLLAVHAAKDPALLETIAQRLLAAPGNLGLQAALFPVVNTPGLDLRPLAPLLHPDAVEQAPESVLFLLSGATGPNPEGVRSLVPELRILAGQRGRGRPFAECVLRQLGENPDLPPEAGPPAPP